jgi:hypothetical protein
MSIEAMKQALEALEIGLEYAESELYENRRRYEGYMHLAPDDQTNVNQIKEAITSLRQALQEEALRNVARLGQEIEQKPVAWRTFDGENNYDFRSYEDNEDYGYWWEEIHPNHEDWVEPLYTHPPKQWVGLTDEEIESLDCVYLNWLDYEEVEIKGEKEFARAIEAKLKEKNG